MGDRAGVFQALSQAAPPPFQYLSNQARSQINLAICLVHQGDPEEGVRLATDALAITCGDVEPNLQQPTSSSRR